MDSATFINGASSTAATAASSPTSASSAAPAASRKDKVFFVDGICGVGKTTALSALAEEGVALDVVCGDFCEHSRSFPWLKKKEQKPMYSGLYTLYLMKKLHPLAIYDRVPTSNLLYGVVWDYMRAHGFLEWKEDTKLSSQSVEKFRGEVKEMLRKLQQLGGLPEEWRVLLVVPSTIVDGTLLARMTHRNNGIDHLSIAYITLQRIAFMEFARAFPKQCYLVNTMNPLLELLPSIRWWLREEGVDSEGAKKSLPLPMLLPVRCTLGCPEGVISPGNVLGPVGLFCSHCDAPVECIVCHERLSLNQTDLGPRFFCRCEDPLRREHKVCASCDRLHNGADDCCGGCAVHARIAQARDELHNWVD